jgi:hypothetical protein
MTTVADVDYADDTMTRSQLARRRGGLDGNGAADLVGHHREPRATMAQVPLEATGLGDQSSLRPARTCRGCGAPLDGKQAVWCSNRCRRRSQNASGSTAAERRRPAEPPPVPNLFDLAGLLAAAVPNGVRFSVEVEGVTITACRA